MTIMNSLAARIDGLTTFIGKSVSYLTLAMVIVICLVVAARHLLKLGSIGLQESAMYLHGAVFMLGIAYTLKENGHVRVDVLHERFSPRTKALIDLFGSLLLLLPVAAFIGFSSLDYVALSWSLGEGSAQPGGLPGVYLLKTLIPVMAALLALQGISEALKNLAKLLSRS